MKTFILRIIAAMAIAAAACITFHSCRKTGINGDLDGQWQVMSIENLSTGEVTNPKRIYYCLFRHTVNLTRGPVAAAGNMAYDGGMLTLQFPSSPVESLADWGIYDEITVFKVEEVNSSRLIIASDRSRISMRRY